MKNRVNLIVAATVAISSVAACSSEAAAKQEKGTLLPGIAQVTIDGKDVPSVRPVQCAPAEQQFSTITLGSEASGATILVSNGGKLAVEFVRIRDLNGFSGDYNRGISDPDASVNMIGSTYQIAGAAVGYGPDSPRPKPVPFTIKLAC